MKNSIEKILIFLSIVTLIIGIFISSPKVVLCSILMLFSHNVLYCLRKYKQRILFLCFNITFFVFLIARLVVTGLFGYKASGLGILGTAFNDMKVVNTILYCLYISLLFLYLGYSFFENNKFKKSITFSIVSKSHQNGYNKNLRLWSFIIFFISIFLRYIYDYEMISTSIEGGYYSTFATFESSLPKVLEVLSSIYDIAFFAFLSTKPIKKQAVPVIFLYLIEGVLLLVAGRRSGFILNILIIVVYVIFRSINQTKEDFWFGKKHVIALSISLPIMIILMSLVGLVRSETSQANSSFSIFNGISEFLFSQGISTNLIGYSKIFETQLSDNKFYTFGPLMEFFVTKITQEYQFFGQTIDRAMNGYLFSHTISYFIMPDLYLRGVGYGSSFVAELYTDFSYIGVAIGSFIYSGIIGGLTKLFASANNIYFTLSFLMAREILFTPRATTLYFVVNTISPLKIMGYILIFGGAYVLFLLSQKNHPIENIYN